MTYRWICIGLSGLAAALTAGCDSNGSEPSTASIESLAFTPCVDDAELCARWDDVGVSTGAQDIPSDFINSPAQYPFPLRLRTQTDLAPGNLRENLAGICSPPCAAVLWETEAGRWSPEKVDNKSDVLQADLVLHIVLLDSDFQPLSLATTTVRVGTNPSGNDLRNASFSDRPLNSIPALTTVLTVAD